MASDPTDPSQATDAYAAGGATAGSKASETSAAEPSTRELLEQLSADRLWLLQQIDGGAWPDLRLDLAALERELGQVLDQASERLTP